MALQTKNFSKTGSASGITYTYIIRVTENSVDTANNESNITVQCILKSSYSGDSFWQYTTTVTAAINGSTKINSTTKRNCSGTGEHLYASWTGDIAHNADGTLPISVSGKISQAYPDYFPSSGISVSGSMTATPITVKYAVSYDANGGENAPSNQEKIYGTALTLSSTIPTRASAVINGTLMDYVFKGWATAANATSATYQPSDSYTTNAALALYAVWEAVARVSLGKPSALVQSVIQNTATITLVHPEYEDGVTFGSWEVTTTSGTHHVSGDTLTVKWDKNETVLAHIRVIDSNGSKSEPIEVVCNVRKNGFCVYDKGRWKKVSPYIYRDGEYKRLNGAIYNEDGTWFKYYCRGTEVTYLTDASGDFLTDESGNVLRI